MLEQRRTTIHKNVIQEDIGKMRSDNIEITHHGRTVRGVRTFPDGEGKFPFVVFNHGYNGSMDSYRNNCELLAQEGIASVRYDFCGGSNRSKSSMKTTDMTILTEVEDLEAVLEEMQSWEQADKSRIFLHGESQGGLISALTADMHEAQIRGLILYFPAFCIAENWNHRFPNLADVPETYELWGMKLGRKFFEALRGFDTFSRVGAFGKKVLIVQGDEDPVVPVAHSRWAANKYPDASLVVLPGEGHGFSPEVRKKVWDMEMSLIKELCGQTDGTRLGSFNDGVYTK